MPFLVFTQYYSLPSGEKSQRIKFQLINNLIVIPLEVNGAKLSFILDSGVSTPILFNLSELDSLPLNNVSEITIKGLGNGEPIKAFSSRGNTFKLKNLRNFSQLLYVVLDKHLNFSPTVGIPIHGIIGYDLFQDFVVDINYGSEVIKFYDPKYYKKGNSKKSETLPLSIINEKAYVDGKIVIEEDFSIPVKLLVDTGSSDAVWLFENYEKGIGIPEKNYTDFLGKGLNGNIFGKRTKVSSVHIGSFSLKNAKAAFPDLESFSAVKDLGNRNGSVGGEILRRFNIIFNYPQGEITLQKNGNFKAPFRYNMSGIALQHNGVRYIAESITDSRGVVNNSERERQLGDVQIMMESKTRISLVPEIIVSGIRAGSPAHEAGLQEGDIVIAVNGKKVHSYKLQEVLEMLNEKKGKRIRLLVERLNKDLTFNFVLRDVFK